MKLYGGWVICGGKHGAGNDKRHRQHSRHTDDWKQVCEEDP
jgi:hypothetical protein